jgi:hypothetical protein
LVEYRKHSQRYFREPDPAVRHSSSPAQQALKLRQYLHSRIAQGDPLVSPHRPRPSGFARNSLLRDSPQSRSFADSHYRSLPQRLEKPTFRSTRIRDGSLERIDNSVFAAVGPILGRSVESVKQRDGDQPVRVSRIEQLFFIQTGLKRPNIHFHAQTADRVDHGIVLERREHRFDKSFHGFPLSWRHSYCQV